MEISIEQYRSRIGSHDNFLKTKDTLSRCKDHFLSLMFMMFYLNVFYLPVLKQVVGQHEMWNDVMFWFSQMIFYNAYISLLIRQASDVEENPGPTIFDVIFQNLVLRVSSWFLNRRKLMKARGRRPSAFIVFECLETPMKHEARVFEIASQSCIINQEQ